MCKVDRSKDSIESQAVPVPVGECQGWLDHVCSGIGIRPRGGEDCYYVNLSYANLSVAFRLQGADCYEMNIYLLKQSL